MLHLKVERLRPLCKRCAEAHRTTNRYAAVGRRDAIEPCVKALLGVADQVFDIELDDVLRARALLVGSTSLSARDAIHAVVMERHGVRRIFSFDAGFDALPAVERIHR